MRRWVAGLFVLCAGLQAQPTISGVANGASFQQTFSPGLIVAIFGTNFGTNPTVTVGSKAAYVLTALSTPVQIAAELPVDLPLGPTTLTVTAGGQTSTAVNLTIAAYAPAFYTAVESGVTVGTFTTASGVAITAANPATPGEPVTGVALGLGATNPAFATGVTPTSAASTTVKATMTIGGTDAAVPYAGTLPNYVPAVYQVNFSVPTSASGCGTNVILTIGGVSSPAVTLPIATPVPIVCSVENSATGLVRDAAHGAAPNSFVTIYAGATVSANSPGNIFPNTTYQGVQASFNGTPVPLYNVTNIPPSVILINTVIPSNAPTSGSATIAVKTSSGASQVYTVELAPADVGVFRLPDPKNPAGVQGVALLANSYWFAMTTTLAAEYGLPACTGLSLATPCGQPASPKDPIVFYFTGGGLATPNADPNGAPVPTGSVAPADGSVIYKTVTMPTVIIGGLPATVGFSGIAPGTASEYQINTSIPSGVTPGDAVPVVVTFGNSTDTFTIAVKAP